jgi:RimJ/RimL family protein N-acetyltransferase
MPGELHTDRLLLRPWRTADAAALLPVLKANTAHLAGWVPSHVISPAPLAALATRLAGFAADFAAGRSLRFGIFPPDQSEVFGEVSLFFRNAEGRVDRAAADRLEIGYWLREDVTGRGYATEAARAMLTLAAGMEGMLQVEIRCDAQNAPSAAVPARLGFCLLEETPSAGGMVWVHELGGTDGSPIIS